MSAGGNKAGLEQNRRPAEQLYLDLDGFEGPLDMLLHLVQAKKLDLSKISVLSLADQYLRFIEQARILRLELAGEYLLTAAWLTYIKSRLVLPQPAESADEAEDSAADLRFRLARLAAMREAAENLFQRPLLGKFIFARGAPQELRLNITHIYQESLYALLTAYGQMRKRRRRPALRIGGKRNFWSPAQARAHLTALLRQMPQGDWLDLRQIPALPAAEQAGDNQAWRRALVGSFVAGLELAREGAVELRQMRAFAPLYLRAKTGRAK